MSIDFANLLNSESTKDTPTNLDAKPITDPTALMMHLAVASKIQVDLLIAAHLAKKNPVTRGALGLAAPLAEGVDPTQHKAVRNVYEMQMPGQRGFIRMVVDSYDHPNDAPALDLPTSTQTFDSDSLKAMNPTPEQSDGLIGGTRGPASRWEN